MARPGTENLGTENLGTARHGKSWCRKILARHGTEGLFLLVACAFLTKYLWIFDNHFGGVLKNDNKSSSIGKNIPKLVRLEM